MADNRPSVYLEGDLVVYRASSSGDCVRALVASVDYEEIRKKEHQELLERSAREGDLHEDSIRQEIASGGWRVVSEQEEIEVEVIPGVILRGHTDGVMEREEGTEKHYIGGTWYADLNTDRALLEAKSMSTKQFAKWMSGKFKNFTKYAFQISVYMKAHPGMDVIYAVKRREDGLLHVTVIPHDKPPVAWKDVKKKILAAERARRAGELPPCDVSTWGCPFFYLHEEEDSDSILDEEMTDDEKAILADLIVQYQELKAIEDAGKRAEEERKERINKPLMNMVEGRDRVVFDWEGVRYQVTLVESSGVRFDKNAMKAELGDAAVEKYEKKYKYAYPVVRVLDDEGDES